MLATDCLANLPKRRTIPDTELGLLDFYTAAKASGRATSEHLDTLRLLAEQCDRVAEFGVKKGASSSALLLGCHQVYSYDIMETRSARKLERMVPRWRYFIQSSLHCAMPACDLLFIDSLHTYAQCRQELARHGRFVRRYLVFHDTLTFGSVGADHETGQQLWTYTVGQSVPLESLGIRPAIDEFMAEHDEWRILFHDVRSHGLLVLERR